jgi:hypothetical protein
MIKKLQISFLFIIPLVFLYIGLQFDRTKYGTDPESAYLMNGLNIATGKAVGHFDNPGTTVQVYSSVVLQITHFLRFNDLDLQTDVLQNSEFYIEVLRKSLIVFNAGILLLLGIAVFLLLHNFWAALLLQVAPFMSVTLIEELYTKVAPEPLLFSSVAILIIMMVKYYTSPAPDSKKYAILFGMLSGFGLATKMTFLPILIIPFIILNGNRNKWLYAIAVIPSFIMFTLPAAKGYMHMAKWFLNLGTHTGTYGQGSAGIIDPVQYFNSLVLIAKNNIALVTVLAIGIVVLFVFRFAFTDFKESKWRKEFYMLLAVLVAIAGSILMVAKHYHSNHYLFPALSLSGFALVLVYLLVNRNLQAQKTTLFRFSLPATVVLIVAFSLTNIPTLTLAYKGYRMSNQSTDETLALLDRDYKDYVKVYYYPVSFNEFSSLRWGNTYSRLYSSAKLMELYPDGLFYNTWAKSFQLWETSIPAGEFVKKYGGKILMVGGPRTYEELMVVKDAGLKLKKIHEGRVQVVYEIDTAKSVFFKEISYSGPTKWKLSNSFESFSDDNHWIMVDDDRFCKNSGLTKEKPRTGSYSFALPSLDTYAMEYELRNVKPGQIYIISIWRYGGSDQASVVVSSKQAGQFYAKSKGFTETDEKGWGKLLLTIKVPEKFTEDRLKVYLWNHGNSPAWFDDLEIIQYK